MNAKFSTLKANLVTEEQAINKIYASLHRYPNAPQTESDLIAVAYFLHNLYSAFESIFQRVAATFENQLNDQAGWHSELLQRMTLDIEGIRPALLSPDAYQYFDELRRFRHVFRTAYRIDLNAERLALARRSAQLLESIYPADVSRFITFLDKLTQEEQQP